MMQKEFASRIIHKHDIETNWNKATNFIPKQGEIIVYDIDDLHDYERIKIGDGVTVVTELPFYQENVAYINESDNETITDVETPSSGASIDVTAQVGQTIVVKEVDVNGKPTAWESADYQERTHWHDVVGTSLVEAEITSSGSSIAKIRLKNERYYLVVWDGVEYVCECKICTYKDTSSDGETRGHYLGNPSRIDWSRVQGTDNGIPFTVFKGDWGGMSCYYDDSETHAISIYQVDMNKIPAEYLPSGSAYSRFKPTVFCEETTVTTADLMGNGWQIAVLPSVTIPLVDGLVYDVLWNGTKYTCEAWYSDNFGSVAMGNRSFFVSNWENTGEPFVMGFLQGSFMLMAYGATESVTATVSIVEHTKIVEKLDDAYYDRAFFVDINVKDDGTYFTTVTPEALKDAYYRNIPIFAQMKYDGMGLSSFVPLTYAFPTNKLGLWSFCGIVEGYIMKIVLNSLDEGISNGIPVEVLSESFEEIIDARLKELGIIEDTTT